MDPLALLREITALPGPPGQEGAVRAALAKHVQALGMEPETDAKGNLLVRLGTGNPRVVVTAHLDEIAMMVRQVEPSGSLVVAPLGGLQPWKLGEGPVSILASKGPLDGVLSFGSMHTNDPASIARQADNTAVSWRMARVRTGRGAEELASLGVRPGTRVVVHPSRRGLTSIGELVAGYFLDDRADLVAWLLALADLKDSEGVLFAATVSEEVGGEGAKYLLHGLRPDVCIALELGPNAVDAPVMVNDQPTVWANDGYAAMSPADGDLVAALGDALGLHLQFQALSRGGSDASCAAAEGLCARPITLGLPMDNTHGYEIMHPGAMANLARLTSGLVRRLAAS